MSEKVEIKYRRALAYPVDLYYLMDLSNSMKDDKQQLEIVSHDLAEALNNLTDQYQIGFGSFVDKVLLPYTDKKRWLSGARVCVCVLDCGGEGGSSGGQGRV